MILGYNTNGFAHHDPLAAVEVLASIGYRSLAITVDHSWLNPFAANFFQQQREIAQALEDHQMGSVIETGARFLLDPYRKHHPSLLADSQEERQQRIDFLKRCLDIAVELKSGCVSLFSGVLPHGVSTQEGLDRLSHSLEPVLSHAQHLNVPIGFEPEPGMFIDSTAGFHRLQQWIDSPQLKLTLDLGHLFCQGEVPLGDYIRRFAQWIVNVHIEDMRAGVHEHLMFGHGDIHFPPVLAALAEVNYQGPVHVELSRHSHDAVNVARHAFEFLSPLVAACQRS